jgi:anti-sigma-K factor RskA
MGRGPTKAELLAEVEGLRASLSALEPGAVAAGHLAKLERAAGPLERRLAEEADLAAGVRRWDARISAGGALSEEEAAACAAALARWKATRLDAAGHTALDRNYRQQAEVLGVLRGRLSGKATASSAPPSSVPLRRVRNMVKFCKGGG